MEVIGVLSWNRTRQVFSQFLLIHHINSKEQIPYWETYSRLFGQKIPRCLWKSKLHYRIHKSSSLGPYLSEIPVSIYTISPKWSLLVSFSAKILLNFSTVPWVMPPSPHLISLTIFSEEYKIWSTSLSSFLYSYLFRGNRKYVHVLITIYLNLKE
jgi:hypothetical protein